MKRSEVLLNLQRFYTQKHVMVEFKYITKDEFMDQVLQIVEEMGMLPPTYRFWNSKNPNDLNDRGIPKDLQYSSRNGDDVNEWEPE